MDWPFVVRDRRRESGAILLIDDKVPEFDKHAGGLFVFQMMELLIDAGVKVLFLPDDRFPRQPYTRVLQRRGVEVLHGHLDVASWMHTNGPYLDWVMAARPHVAPRYVPLVRSSSDARLLYYTVDLHSVRERRRYELTGDLAALKESERLKAIEKSIVASVDCVVTPSVDEKPSIVALGAKTEVRVIPPYASASGTTENRTSLSARRSVIFVAGFDHPPNVDAAMVLVREIMPIVWRDVPDARVLLVGSNPQPEIRALSGSHVTVTGYVPDLMPYYALSRMSVNPLRFGAGVKGKILSSMEAGVPVITTGIGNEGINLENGRHALVGDTIEVLADHIVGLFREPELAESLAAAARGLLAERFGPARTREQLFAALG